MQITINQKTIEQAIADHVRSQVSINEDQQIKMELKATRGKNGFQAVIEIVSADEAAASASAKSTRKARQAKAVEAVEPETKNGNVPAGKTVADAPETTQVAADNAPVAEAPVEAAEAPATEPEPAEEAAPPAFLQKGSIFGNNVQN